MITSRRLVLFLSVVVCLSAPGQLAAQPNPTYADFRALLSDIREAVRAGNEFQALELLARAMEVLNQLEERSVRDEEAVLWDIAQLNLQRADEMQEYEEIVYFAAESVRRWQDYHGWYAALSEEQRTILRDNPKSYRIQRASRQLGLAIVRRGNRDPHSIRDLFSTYVNLPVEYLNPHSIDLWRYWLIRCPTWEEPATLSIPQLPQERVAACREEWLQYQDYLSAWVEEPGAPPQSVNRSTRWIREIGERFND